MDHGTCDLSLSSQRYQSRRKVIPYGMTLLRAWHLCSIPPKIRNGMYNKVFMTTLYTPICIFGGSKITTMYMQICIFGGIGDKAYDPSSCGYSFVSGIPKL